MENEEEVEEVVWIKVMDGNGPIRDDDVSKERREVSCTLTEFTLNNVRVAGKSTLLVI